MAILLNCGEPIKKCLSVHSIEKDHILCKLPPKNSISE